MRFLVFNILSWVGVVIWAPLLLLTGLFSHNAAYAIGRSWCVMVAILVRLICGLRYRVEGKANFPEDTSVFLIKHSSAFETFMQLVEFPRACWVLKRELLYVPFFGWSLWMLKGIGINRGARGLAVKQVIEQGRERLEQGICVSIFPEGTRMPAGETRRYGLSGVLLAQNTGRKIVPIAHNAGYHWPRRGFAVIPGEVVFVIGEPIDPTGRDPRELNAEIQTWIEAQVQQIVSNGRTR